MRKRDTQAAMNLDAARRKQEYGAIQSALTGTVKEAAVQPEGVVGSGKSSQAVEKALREAARKRLPN
jgi:hypothetical protein